jgi:hypothetical protein
MAALTSSKLKNLRNLLSAKPDQDVLRLYLQKRTSEIGLLQQAMLVTIHRKWSEHPPHHLTELGITTYDRLRVNNGQDIMSGPHAEDHLRHVWCLHLVIRPHAHLDSETANVTAYHFGTTIYVSQEDALDLLHQIWHQPIDPWYIEKGLRPIVYMSFGNDDSVAKMRKAAFDFDPATLSTTVATLDAQIIPQQSKITRHATATFEYLLHQFKITAFHPDNAGNAAMYATVIAILSALRFEVYGWQDNRVAKPCQTGPSSCKAAQSVVQSLMEWPTPAPPFGVTVYCWRCGSGKHAFGECPNDDLSCGRCEKSIHQWRRENAGGHMEGLCVFR